MGAIGLGTGSGAVFYTLLSGWIIHYGSLETYLYTLAGFQALTSLPVVLAVYLGWLDARGRAGFSGGELWRYRGRSVPLWIPSTLVCPVDSLDVCVRAGPADKGRIRRLERGGGGTTSRGRRGARPAEAGRGRGAGRGKDGAVQLSP